ncbi:MAG: hypothetical protein WB507_03820 [Solirubrobacterales bacterium]
MSTVNPGVGRVLAGAGGALLIASLFLPWVDGPGGATRDGWALLRVSDVFFFIVGLHGIAAAITGGRRGYFRPDLSLNGTADILAVVAMILLIWLIAFEFPAGVGRGAGIYLALISSVAIVSGAGDFRAKELFPRI